MSKQRTVGQYRAVDLALFAAMLLVFETVIIQATLRWFPGQPYTVSLVPAITAIVLIRWGPWAGIHALLGAVILCAESGAAASQYAIYALGNLFALASLPLLRLFGGSGEITRRSGKALVFGLLVLVLMQLGRALISLLFGNGPDMAAGFFTTEVITDLFTLVILWIVRRLDGVLEDQKHYLIRLREEEQTKF